MRQLDTPPQDRGTPCERGTAPGRTGRAPSRCLLVRERPPRLPISPPSATPGTGFWAQGSLGHRVEAPATVLRPPAGTALLFGGHVTHAGMPVTAGERAVFVASFSPRGGLAERVEAAAQSRDIYGDLL